MKSNEFIPTLSFNRNIKFERKYSTELSNEEYYSYQTRDPEKIETDFNQLHKDFNAESEENQQEIVLYQKQMNYKQYLRTRYWCICRNKVYLRDGFKCKIKETHPNTYLNVHHPSYEYRGNEANNIDKLTTYCRDCHDFFEKREKEKQNDPAYQQDVTERINELEIAANICHVANGNAKTSKSVKKVKATKPHPIKKRVVKVLPIAAKKKRVNGKKKSIAKYKVNPAPKFDNSLYLNKISKVTEVFVKVNELFS